MSIHADTMKCLDKAIKLQEEGSEDHLRYACLQLRMAIEHLFYELLPIYKAELPTAVFDQWQPSKILDALIECNPDVMSDSQVALKDAPSEKVLFCGSQTAVSKKLLRDNYHRLGSFLHAPLHGKPLSLDNLTLAVTKAIQAIETYRSDRVLFNFGQHIEFGCSKCGHKFKRQVRAIPKDGKVHCLNSACAALHRVRVEPSGEFTTELATVRFTCQSCEAETLLDEPDCRPNCLIRCVKCCAEYRIIETLTCEPVNSNDRT